jgi:Tfp pilus assembly protein PilZ
MPRAKRHPRRVALSFEEIGAKTPQKIRGYSTNISLTGIFVATTQLLPVGTRLKIELEDGSVRIPLEGVVTRVQKVPPELRTVVQIGMGLRFLTPPENLAKLLPAATADELAAAARPAPAPAAALAPVAALPHGRAFTVKFASPQEWETVRDRDVRRGGVFVATASPAALHETVQVTLAIPGSHDPPTFAAKVVHAMPAGMAVEFVDRAAVNAALKPAGA